MSWEIIIPEGKILIKTNALIKNQEMIFALTAATKFFSSDFSDEN